MFGCLAIQLSFLLWYSILLWTQMAKMGGDEGEKKRERAGEQTERKLKTVYEKERDVTGNMGE